MIMIYVAAHIRQCSWIKRRPVDVQYVETRIEASSVTLDTVQFYFIHLLYIFLFNPHKTHVNFEFKLISVNRTRYTDRHSAFYT